MRKPLFPGNNDVDQVMQILTKLGRPADDLGWIRAEEDKETVERLPQRDVRAVRRLFADATGTVPLDLLDGISGI